LDGDTSSPSVGQSHTSGVSRDEWDAPQNDGESDSFERLRNRIETRRRHYAIFRLFHYERRAAAWAIAPSPEEMAEIWKFHKEATKSGVIVATGRLSPTTTIVRKEGRRRVSVTDGPFIEPRPAPRWSDAFSLASRN
jgi:hypothetical protein